MATYSFFLGDFIVRAGFRWSERDRMRDYRKWRVEAGPVLPRPVLGVHRLGRNVCCLRKRHFSAIGNIHKLFDTTVANHK